MNIAFEKDTYNNLVTMITDGYSKVRYFKRWNGTSWDNPPGGAISNIAPPNQFVPGNDCLFISEDNTYYYFYFDKSATTFQPLYMSKSTDRGVTWSNPETIDSNASAWDNTGSCLVAIQNKINITNYKLAYSCKNANSDYTIKLYPDNTFVGTKTVYNHNMNCDYSGNFHNVYVQYGSPNYSLYYDNNLVKSDSTISKQYNFFSNTNSTGSNTNARSPLLGLDFKKNSNIAYILYTRSFGAGNSLAGFAFIEYDTSTNTVIYDQYIAKVSLDTSSALNTIPNASGYTMKNVQSTKMIVLQDGTIRVFLSLNTGTQSFYCVYQGSKATGNWVWSLLYGPTEYIQSATGANYAAYDTRYLL
jgi:hypothetical protein